MAIRQYIGARYVPKFYEGTSGSEWDANVQYEPLTIVTYLNNTYTSKKFVPASVGSPMANPDYWVATGLYNAQLNALTERVDGIETTVGDNDSGLVKDVNDLNTAVGEQATSIQNINESIEDIEEEIEGLTTGKERKYVLISDSYGRYPSAETCIGAQFLEKVGACSASDYVHGSATKINDSAYVYSSDGKAFLVDFDVMLSAVANICTNKSEITDIIVWGGINDSVYYSTQAPLESAMRNFNTIAKTNFPNAMIHFYNCGANHHATVDYTAQYDCNIIHRDMAVKLGWDYAKDARVTLFSNRVDSSHPTATGADICAELMYEFIINGQELCTINETTVTLTSSVDNGTLTTTPACTIKWMGAVSQITIAPIRVTKSSSGNVVLTLTLDEGSIHAGQKINLNCKGTDINPSIGTDYKTITIRIPDALLTAGETYGFGYLTFLVNTIEIS